MKQYLKYKINVWKQAITLIFLLTDFPLLAHTYPISPSRLDVGQSLLHMHFGTLVLFLSGLRITWHSLGESHLKSVHGLQSPFEITSRALIRFSQETRSKWHWDWYWRPLEPISHERYDNASQNFQIKIYITVAYF